MERLKGKCIVPGVGRGEALVSKQPLHLYVDIEQKTGKIINRQLELFGKFIEDKVLVFPYGKGSSSSSITLVETLRLGRGPVAIINLRTESILVIASLVAEELYSKGFPIFTVSSEVFNLLNTGDFLTVNSNRQEIIRKSVS